MPMAMLSSTRLPMRISPAVAVSSPASMRRMVDLPQPEGPRMQVKDPSAMVSERPSTAGAAPLA